MKLTELEKKLLRQQAEGYAFIFDLRRIAIMNRDIRYVRLTEGIDDRVAQRQKEYPTLFKRYFNEALKKAEAQRMSSINAVPEIPKPNVKREKIPRRKKAPKKAPKKVESRRSVRRRDRGGIAKSKPE